MILFSLDVTLAFICPLRPSNKFFLKDKSHPYKGLLWVWPG